MRGGPNGAARRLDADDLFGMAELTGDAPLGDLSKPPPLAPHPNENGQFIKLSFARRAFRKQTRATVDSGTCVPLLAPT